MNKSPVYFDYAATTPLDPRVMEAMSPYFTEIFGNPSSLHSFGQKAEAALEEAREKVANCLHCSADEVIFTGCGTESDNLALRGTAIARRKKGNYNHLLISPVEHPAVIKTARRLAEEAGFELEILPVDQYGMIDPDDVRGALRPETALVSIIYGNNEIGTINPVQEIARVCSEKSVPFHTDAVQAAAHLDMDVRRDGVNLLSMGAHKFHGPKGVGVLYVRKGTDIGPAQTGGKQENKLRGGTHNVPLIVGLARAFELAQETVDERRAEMIPLRDRLIAGVLAGVSRSKLTGHPVQRLPNHASFVFENVDGNSLVRVLDMEGYACSSGSACKVGNPKPSEILTAIGLSANWATGSLRVTLGRDSTLEEVERFIEILPAAVQKTRSRHG